MRTHGVRYFLNPVLRDLEGQADLDGKALNGNRFLAEYGDSSDDPSQNIGVQAGEKLD